MSRNLRRGNNVQTTSSIGALDSVTIRSRSLLRIHSLTRSWRRSENHCTLLMIKQQLRGGLKLKISALCTCCTRAEVTCRVNTLRERIFLSFHNTNTRLPNRGANIFANFEAAFFLPERSKPMIRTVCIGCSIGETLRCARQTINCRKHPKCGNHGRCRS